MLGRIEQAEAGVMTINASYGNMKTVSQTEINTIVGDPDGRSQFITYEMELPVRHGVYQGQNIYFFRRMNEQDDHTGANRLVLDKLRLKKIPVAEIMFKPVLYKYLNKK